MTPAATFRAVLIAAVVFALLGIAALANHFIQPAGSSPFFGAKLGLLFLAVAACCAVYANYNRPGTRV